MKKARFFVALLAMTALTASFGFGYALLGKKWFSTPEWYINDANFPSSISKSSGLKACQDSVSAWGSTLGKYVGASSLGTANDGVNVISFTRLRNGVLAQTYVARYDSSQTQTCNGTTFYRFTDTDIEVQNWGINWTVAGGSCSGQYDMYGVMVHEVGHAIGLGHSSVSGATMYPSVSACDFSIGSLEKDDTNGRDHIYSCDGGGGGGGGSTCKGGWKKCG
jgi:hypothetical protein